MIKEPRRLDGLWQQVERVSARAAVTHNAGFLIFYNRFYKEYSQIFFEDIPNPILAVIYE